jgi:hypothetical protein
MHLNILHKIIDIPFIFNLFITVTITIYLNKQKGT